ncbi:transporter [Ganoderma sinense ZZ0214-1]|uniref:non-specific serine/threonine protein kinase n=1 Tax=Ganoderma sinense ZZ0214-1 TaxID=1077348 RepID=A0A2G8S5F8_9APHY|nr:transporter [Ganoderma sinense ZZ0214-1]
MTGPPIARSFLNMDTTGIYEKPAALTAPDAHVRKYRDVGVQTDGDEDPSEPKPPRKGPQILKGTGHYLAKKLGWIRKHVSGASIEAQPPPSPPPPHLRSAVPERPLRPRSISLDSTCRDAGREMPDGKLYTAQDLNSSHHASSLPAQPAASPPHALGASELNLSDATSPLSDSPSPRVSSGTTSRSSASSITAPRVEKIGVNWRGPIHAPPSEPRHWTVIQRNNILIPPLEEGKWTTGGVLGSGGFARVYEVFNAAIQEACALKVVRVGRKMSGSACTGIINELKVLSVLASDESPPPFLLQPCLSDSLWAWQSSSGNLHILTEVCEGGSLAEYRFRIGYDSLVAATAEIISGLYWLHKHGIVHHDLKPQNVLVSGNGHCVIADYGGARFLNDKGKLIRGNNTPVVMTTSFAAPEVLMSLEDGECLEYDEAADYWSLGLTVVSMFLPDEYLPGTSDRALMAFRLGKLGQELRGNGVPAELQAFIMDLLCMDPEERCRYPAITKQRLFQHLDWADVENLTRPVIPIRDLVCDAHGWEYPPLVAHKAQDSTADFFEELRAHNLALEVDDSYDVVSHHAHMNRCLAGRVIPRF